MNTDFNMNVTFSKDVINGLVAQFGKEGAIKEVSETLTAVMHAQMAELREALYRDPE